MYVAVKGGERAIENAHRLMAEDRRGNPDIPDLSVDQIREQMTLAVDRVMTEGSLYDPDLAALAIKQARGDLVEAIFLVRAYRTTLSRLAESVPVESARMKIDRRISATFKDVPGGQILGPTFDYTHRLIDFKLAADGGGLDEETPAMEKEDREETVPHVLDLLATEGLVEQAPSAKPDARIADITRDPPEYPMEREARLQSLARGDEGYLLALGYSTQRGYARTHPFAGEIRTGRVRLEIVPDELGFPIEIGEIVMTECNMITQFQGSKTEKAKFTRGYGISFGRGERKAMAMALVDRSLRAKELNEELTAPAQDEEFVLSHCDNVQASGFVEHLKLPHYVDFQSELKLVRRLRTEMQEQVQTTEASQ
jgi:alpha-D-ribose 1-methylphosphonate 5-triphosphate synthase subunit PhnI